MSKFDVVIKNGKIWNGTEFLTDADGVAIKDRIVAEIGRVSDDADVVIDAKSAIISPGLVDIHTHIKGCSSHAFGVPIEAVCYPNGVTTAVEASACKQTGKAILDNMWLDSYVFVAANVKNNAFDWSFTEKMLDVYKEKVLGVKVFFDTASPEIKDTKPLVEICEYAHKRNLKVLVHSTGSPVPMDELLGCLCKGDICTHIFHGGKNNVSEDNFKCLDNARKRGVVLDNGMAGGVHTDFEVAKSAILNGFLPDTISTDITKLSAFVRGGNYGLTLCMSIMRKLGMKEQDILKAVTYYPSRAICKEKRCGKLEVGGKADVCVLDYTSNPFDMPSKWCENIKGDMGYKNSITIVNGKVMFRR